MNNTFQQSYFKTKFNKDIVIDSNHLLRIPLDRIVAQCREFLAMNDCCSGPFLPFADLWINKAAVF